MKTSKQDIHDLLSQLAADIEEIKALLNSAAAGAGAASKNNAISNEQADGTAVGLPVIPNLTLRCGVSNPCVRAGFSRSLRHSRKPSDRKRYVCPFGIRIIRP